MEAVEPKPNDRIIPRVIEDEMKKSYIDYAMSVIVGRALPDVRDGLKPVHRRILFAMNELGIVHSKPYKKSARIVGEVLGKYHPHGDVAVYDSLVRMAQEFSLRYPLIEGQGNFGSIDGDSAAAMRYTECRLAKISEDLLEDIEKETVDFTPNFDGTLKEPSVLPCKLPNLLINGSSGIAVGMATNIPPHNIREVAEGVVAVIEKPDITTQELMQHIKGPDFPTSASILGRGGIFEAYDTGRGKIRIRAKAEIKVEKNKPRIIVTEIPYQVNKSVLLEEIADLVRDKRIEGISDIRDESDREGIRVIFEIKKDAQADVVLNQLYQHTNLSVTFGIILLSLVNNEPKILTLKDTITYFIKHRQDVIRKRTQYELTKAEERVHVILGLIIALNNIDDVVKKIKSAKDAQAAANALMTNYSLTEIQAKAILDMKLQRLASLEQEKIRTEHTELEKAIIGYKEILESEPKILGIIKKELQEAAHKYDDPRKTEIVDGGVEDITEEKLIKQEDVVVTVTHTGYVKRTPIDTYKQQGRGGKGIIGTDTKEQDFVEHMFVANTHSYLLLFTNKGKIHWIKVYDIPTATRTSLGKSIVNIVELEQGEKISAFIPVNEFDDKHFLLMATKNGTVKKTNLIEYSRPRKGGIIAITLDDADELIDVLLTSGNDEIILASKNGHAIRFKEIDVRACGRSASGVRGMNLREDEVIGAVKAEDAKTIFTITENGYGKRTKMDEYSTINRGGLGVINIQCSERNGKVVSINSVTEDDDLMIISKSGIIIRTPARMISVIGRNTQGVRVMRLEDGDKVVVSAIIAQE